MKRLISDKELVAYISGQLSKEETRILHAKAVENHESDLLLHAQLASLACNEELADELLGEDDFMQENTKDIHPLSVAAKDLSFAKEEESKD